MEVPAELCDLEIGDLSHTCPLMDPVSKQMELIQVTTLKRLWEGSGSESVSVPVPASPGRPYLGNY